MSEELKTEVLKVEPKLQTILIDEMARNIRKMTSILSVMAERLERIENVVFPSVQMPTFDVTDYKVTRTARFCESRRKGRLDQFLLISSTSNFKVRVSRDNQYVLNYDFTELVNLAPYLPNVMATEVNGKYYVFISDYSWENNFYVEIVVPGTVIFDRVFYTWREAKV